MPSSRYIIKAVIRVSVFILHDLPVARSLQTLTNHGLELVRFPEDLRSGVLLTFYKLTITAQVHQTIDSETVQMHINKPTTTLVSLPTTSATVL